MLFSAVTGSGSCVWGWLCLPIGSFTLTCSLARLGGCCVVEPMDGIHQEAHGSLGGVQKGPEIVRVPSRGHKHRIIDLRCFCSSREAFAWVWRKLVDICARKINLETLLWLEYVFRAVWLIAWRRRPSCFDTSSRFCALRVCFHIYLSFVSFWLFRSHFIHIYKSYVSSWAIVC